MRYKTCRGQTSFPSTCSISFFHGLALPVDFGCSPFPHWNAVQRQRPDDDYVSSKYYVYKRDNSKRDGGCYYYALEDANRFLLSARVHIFFLCSPRLRQTHRARWSFRDSSASVLGFLQESYGSIFHYSHL
jgi:hypothetical protein